MSSFDDVRNRIKRGQDVKSRVLQRLSTPVNVEDRSEQSIFSAVRNRPIDYSPVSGTPMSELNKKYGAFSAPNLLNATIQEAVQKQATANTPQQKTEYEINKELYESMSPYNPVKYYASGMNWLMHGNPVGRFFSRIGHQADNVLSGGNPVRIRLVAADDC